MISKMTAFFQNLFGGIETGSMYALACMGLILIYQTANMANFAQGTLGMFNAYICTMFVLRAGFPLPLAILTSIVIAFVIGAVIDRGIMAHARGFAGIGKEIVTLGFIIVFTGLAPMLFGASDYPFSKIIKSQIIDIAGVKIDPNSILTIGLTAVIMFALFYTLQFTKIGLAVRVTAANTTVAKLMGVQTSMITTASWAIATALGCLTAVLLAPKTNINLTMMAGVHTSTFIASVLGGFQTFYGPVVGALILGVANNLVAFYVSSKWASAIVYALVLIFAIFRPNGLFGKKVVKKV